MNIKRIICIMTVSCLFSTAVCSAVKPTTVHAKELKTTTTSDVDARKSTQNEKFENLANTVKQIEEVFLKQNEDGTFYIDDKAYNAIDSETVDFIKSNMEEINSLIRSNILEFKMSNINGQVKIEVVKDNSKTITQKRVKRSTSGGRILSNYSYCSNYQWFWWGYTTILNSKGCELLQNETECEAAIVGAATTLCGFIPVVGAAGAATALFGEAIIYGNAIKELKNGKITGKAKVVGIAKPSSGKVWQIEAIY